VWESFFFARGQICPDLFVSVIFWREPRAKSGQKKKMVRAKRGQKKKMMLAKSGQKKDSAGKKVGKKKGFV
jgi:hypothetical protein